MTELVYAKVRVGDRTYQYHAGLESIDFQHALSLEHRKGTTFCLCNRDTPVRLSVRRYERDANEVFYGLAKWPDTGLEHGVECIFFGEDASSGGAHETKPAFEDLPDGQQRVYLATSLALNLGLSVETPTTPGGKSGSGTSRQRATEITLLLNLWRRARLNVYKGKSRHWFNACFMLLAAAKKTVLNKNGGSLSEYLLLGAGREDRLVKDHNETLLRRAREQPSRLFVIGRMRAKSSDKSQFMLSFKDFNSLPRISVSSRVYEDFVGKRAHVKCALENDQNVVVLACIEPSGTEWWKVVHLTGIATSKNFIPVESSYEMTFDDYLASNSRTYLKPLAVDEGEESLSMRPDFILLDTIPRAYCEVWGMSTPEYLASKVLKEKKYRERGLPLVSWSPMTDLTLPSLPSPAVQAIDRSYV